MATVFTLVPTAEPLLSSAGTTVHRVTSINAQQGKRKTSTVTLIALGNATDTMHGTQDNGGFVGLVRFDDSYPERNYAVNISTTGREALQAGTRLPVPLLNRAGYAAMASAVELDPAKADIWGQVLGQARGAGGLVIENGEATVLGGTFGFSTAYLRAMYRGLPGSLPRPRPLQLPPTPNAGSLYADAIESPVPRRKRDWRAKDASPTPARPQPTASWLETVQDATSHAATIAGKMTRAAVGWTRRKSPTAGGGRRRRPRLTRKGRTRGRASKTKPKRRRPKTQRRSTRNSRS